MTTKVEKPRCLAIDQQNNYLVTVGQHSQSIYRFHLHNLTKVDEKNLTSGIRLMNIVYRENFFYLSDESGNIIIVESQNLTSVSTIHQDGVTVARDIIFLQEGQTMVLASANRITFFNRCNASNNNYTYSHHLSTPYSTAHGLFHVNDTFFHLVFWIECVIYSYSKIDDKNWTGILFADATSKINGECGGSHVTIDDCGRRWFSVYKFGILIYNDRGDYLGNFTRFSKDVFGAVFIKNYVLYLSDMERNYIRRIDPKITC